jgi:hypothetical protein
MQTVPQQGRILTIANAPPGVQEWVDAFVEAARAGAPGDWPHPHPEVPQKTVSLEALWRRIEENFGSAQGPWSVVANGFPPTLSVAEQRKGEPDPSKGSSYHNLLHSLLGDFHRPAG